jgi:hypothetical protein
MHDCWKNSTKIGKGDMHGSGVFSQLSRPITQNSPFNQVASMAEVALAGMVLCRLAGGVGRGGDVAGLIGGRTCPDGWQDGYCMADPLSPNGGLLWQ